jgi:hypothetical protein
MKQPWQMYRYVLPSTLLDISIASRKALVDQHSVSVLALRIARSLIRHFKHKLGSLFLLNNSFEDIFQDWIFIIRVPCLLGILQSTAGLMSAGQGIFTTAAGKAVRGLILFPSRSATHCLRSPRSAARVTWSLSCLSRNVSNTTPAAGSEKVLRDISGSILAPYPAQVAST